MKFYELKVGRQTVALVRGYSLAELKRLLKARAKNPRRKR